VWSFGEELWDPVAATEAWGDWPPFEDAFEL